jgi:hypothetical protein
MMKTWCKSKSVDHENEVMGRWHMSGSYVHNKINVGIEYGEPRLHGNGETIYTKIRHLTWFVNE